MKYFCVADIHGFYDELITALNNSGFDSDNPNHTLIVLGDILDRGPKPQEIIDYLSSLSSDRFIFIRGNHEDLLEMCLETKKYGSHDIHNRTFKTICDLAKMSEQEGFYSFGKACEIVKRCGICELINKAIDYYEVGKYIFVHGYIPLYEDSYGQKHYYSDWRNATLLMWEDARWYNGMLYDSKGINEKGHVIVCGHYSCFWGNEMFKHKKECFEPFITDTIVALDGTTYYSKKVNVYIIDNPS